MPDATDFDGEAQELHFSGPYVLSLRNRCDPRKRVDRGDVPEDCIPGLRWRWLLATAMVDDWLLTRDVVCDLMQVDLRAFERMTARTRRLVTQDSLMGRILQRCDNRNPRDNRSQLAEGRIPGLRIKWVVALAMVDLWGLSVGEAGRFLGVDKGHASREVNRTRALLQSHGVEEFNR